MEFSDTEGTLNRSQTPKWFRLKELLCILWDVLRFNIWRTHRKLVSLVRALGARVPEGSFKDREG